MNFKNSSKEFFLRFREGLSVRTLLTAAVIAVIVVFNTVLFGLASNYSWYFRTDEVLKHDIGTALDGYLNEVADKGDVQIIFCDTPEALEGDQVYNLVWQTAHQFAAKHEFVTVPEPVNIFTDPASVEKYKYEIDKETGKYVLDEDGKRKQINAITRSSVIFAGEHDYAVLPMQSFFILDSEKLITAYNGEEVTAAMIHRVQTAVERPTAYFTMSHGETYSTAFMNRLISAGYAMQAIDLVASDLTYRKGDIIVVSNPQFDFFRGNADKGVVGEIDKMEEFLAEGGSVLAMLDPLVTNTVQLEKFLASWGLTITRAETEASSRDTVMVRDNSNSIPSDGYALISEISETGLASGIAAGMKEIDAGRVIISRASPITLTSPEGRESAAVLTSSSTSAGYADGELVDDKGRYAIAAISRDAKTGGCVFAVSSVYLTAEDALTTNEYGNRDFIYFMLEEMGGVSMPTGGTLLLFDEVAIEDLTMWEARLFTILVAVAAPIAVVGAGAVILIKRRNR